MFKKIKYFCNYILLLVAVAAVSVCISGCRTTQSGGYTEQSILEHQARIIELENRNIALTERLTAYDSLVDGTVGRLEIIGERAGRIVDTTDRIIYLFSEYEREVQFLVRELFTLRRTVRAITTTCHNPLLDIGCVDCSEAD